MTEVYIIFVAATYHIRNAHDIRISSKLPVRSSWRLASSKGPYLLIYLLKLGTFSLRFLSTRCYDFELFRLFFNASYPNIMTDLIWASSWWFTWIPIFSLDPLMGIIIILLFCLEHFLNGLELTWPICHLIRSNWLQEVLKLRFHILWFLITLTSFVPQPFSFVGILRLSVRNGQLLISSLKWTLIYLINLLRNIASKRLWVKIWEFSQVVWVRYVFTLHL